MCTVAPGSSWPCGKARSRVASSFVETRNDWVSTEQTQHYGYGEAGKWRRRQCARGRPRRRRGPRQYLNGVVLHRPPPTTTTSSCFSSHHGPFEEEQRRPMSFACDVGEPGMLEAVPLSSVVVDPYLLAATGSGLTQQQQQQQQQRLLAFQISENACCGAASMASDVDAMRISPPPAPPHQMINRFLTLRLFPS